MKHLIIVLSMHSFLSAAERQLFLMCEPSDSQPGIFQVVIGSVTGIKEEKICPLPIPINLNLLRERSDRVIIAQHRLRIAFKNRLEKLLSAEEYSSLSQDDIMGLMQNILPADVFNLVYVRPHYSLKCFR